jgi:hypothetical protein
MQQKVVKVSTRMNSCPLCSAKLVKKYNKKNRHIITLNGEFWVRERVLRCSNRECPENALSFRAEDFQAAIIPYMIFGLDVILHIGTLRACQKITCQIFKPLQNQYHLSRRATTLRHFFVVVALISLIIVS